MTLGACTGGELFSSARVDPLSPAAARVTEAAQAPANWPSFSDIPPVPTDAPSAAAWREPVGRTLAAGAQASEAERRYRYDVPSAEATGAFAAEQQRRATPPPPPQ